MIEVDSLGLNEDGQYYTIKFERLQFAIIDVPNLKYLQYFSRSNQQLLGKTTVRLPFGWLKTCINFYRRVNYILLTQYQEILILPYLIRAFPEIKILATNLMYQLARIYLTAFQQKIKDYDSTSIIISYDEQTNINEAYQNRLEIDITQNPTVFNIKEVEQVLSKIIRVNYFQIYDTERGVSIIAQPSGKNNGSCFWHLQSQISKTRILIINQISHHNWRTCQPLNEVRLQAFQKQRKYDHVIFTKKSLSSLKQQNKSNQYLKKIASNMNNSVNTVLIINDDSNVIDLIPRISFQPQGKCQAAYFSNGSFHDFANYCNSYVDYLSDPFRSIIFGQSPDYPLIHYSRLKQRGLIFTDGIQETAIKKHLPIKEIILQSQPFILFLKDYQYYLQSQDLSILFQDINTDRFFIKFQNNFDKLQLQKFLGIFRSAKFWTFDQIETDIDSNINKLCLNSKHIIGQQSQFYCITATNLSENIGYKFILQSNRLELSPINTQIIILSRYFIDQIVYELNRRGINVLKKNQNYLQTQNTSIYLSQSQYNLKIQCKNADQLLIIEKILLSIGQQKKFS